MSHRVVPHLLILLTLLLPARFAVAGTADWMRRIPDPTRLSALSLPGTHDTMANEANAVVDIELNWVLTQNMELRPQLDAGIRVLDIRARHIENIFTIHHDKYYLNANFHEVLDTTIQFLKDHPTETVLMRVKKEHTEEDTNRTFTATFEWYRDQAAYHPYIWQGTHVPALGEVRGKIVILDDFEGGDHGIPWSSLNIQDQYEQTDTDDKWNSVRNQLVAADSGSSSELYINFLSASGSDGDCAIWYSDLPPIRLHGTPLCIAEDINARTHDYLAHSGIQRTGVLMMDFPEQGLIDAIIARNHQPAAEHYRVGDYNGDGRTDWSWYSPPTREFIVMLSDGQGGFTTRRTDTSLFGNWTGGRFFSTGDYNGDGRTDWSWYAPWSHDFIVMLSNGQGGFTPAYNNTSSWGDWAEGRFFSTGDYNGDGRTDWSWYAPWSRDFIVMLSNGQGGFTSKHNNTFAAFGDWAEGRFFSTGDYNGDGRTDWSWYAPWSRDFIVMTSNGQGGFTPSYNNTFAAFGDWAEGRFFSTGDYNGDGRTDWSWYAPWSRDFIVMLSNGQGGFTPSYNNTSSWGDWAGGRFFSTGDYNGDGRTDWSWYAPWTHDFIAMLANDQGGFISKHNHWAFIARMMAPESL